MWYTKFGESGDVVLSSRVRLARNLADLPFGAAMNAQQRGEMIERCRKALPEMKFIDLGNMSSEEKHALAECHLISPDMAECKEQTALLTNEDCSVCIMLGEEDHIRIQAMAPGLSLDKCLEAADRTDDELEKTVDYGFDERFGYLTCCPTNVGTGMRASAMLHLPALTAAGKIEGVVRSLSKLGLAVRGIYGEGSRAEGNIYQISNQVTLGVSERETVEKLKQVIDEVVQQERETSRNMYAADRLHLEDRLMRSYGILTNARLLTSGETMNLISDVRWGINLGIIKNINLERLSELLYDTLPANMIKKYNLKNPTERDIRRAELCREGLAAAAGAGAERNE